MSAAEALAPEQSVDEVRESLSVTEKGQPANTIGNFNANVNNGGNVSYLTSDLAHFNLNGGGTVSQTSSFALSDFTSTRPWIHYAAAAAGAALVLLVGKALQRRKGATAQTGGQA